MAGMSLNAGTGIGTPVPGPYTLFSVAAIVLGGVSLAGGRGGVFGAIVAVVILQLIKNDLTFLNFNSNLALVSQGVILIGVVAVGSCFPDAPEQGSLMAAPSQAEVVRPSAGSTIANIFRDRPVIPLILLLVGLIVVLNIFRPGITTPNWAAIIIRTAVPLAILAGCQTLTMLTGGIDLSVGAVASMAGFLVATLVGDFGFFPSILIALFAAVLAGTITGIGVGVFRVHPLIMTLGMSFVVLGLANVWQLMRVQTGSGVPQESADSRRWARRWSRPEQPHRLRADRDPDHHRSATDRLWPVAVCDR